MIDVHCHLQFHRFEKDYEEVARRAFDSGVTRIINVGTKIDSSQQALIFANRYDNMYAIVGVHPHHADKLDNTWISDLESFTKDKKVIGIGEIGLDYFHYQSNGIVDPVIQEKIFIQQIDLAHKTKLPLQIHNRHAGKYILEILNHHRDLLQNPPGMFHCFAGDVDTLKSALEMGFYIGFDGNVTYKGLAPGENTELKELAKYTPLDRLVVETDSPFLTPVPHRGERNEPAYVLVTGKFIAELKNVQFDAFVDQTTQNVYTVFTKLK